MTRYGGKHQNRGSATEVEGYPMDFKEYGYDLLDPGVHKGVVLMIKEHRAGVMKYVIGVAVGGDPQARGRDGKLAPLVQINGFVKVGTSWFDNLVEVLEIDMREGDDVETHPDWRARRGWIVEADVEHEAYENKEGKTEDRNRITQFLRARPPNDQDRERGRDERRPSKREEQEREKDRRAGPWGGRGDDRGSRDRGRGDDRRDSGRGDDRRDSRDRDRGSRDRDDAREDRDRDRRERDDPAHDRGGRDSYGAKTYGRGEPPPAGDDEVPF